MHDTLNGYQREQGNCVMKNHARFPISLDIMQFCGDTKFIMLCDGAEKN